MEGLTAIVALAETSDMAKAGELLHIGPGAVIKRLSKAENDLFAKLFRKTKNRIALTADGRIYCSEASLAIEHAVLAEEKITAARRLRERRLLVGQIPRQSRRQSLGAESDNSCHLYFDDSFMKRLADL
jgi:DNA-binding transcriptional LysR family regulator